MAFSSDIESDEVGEATANHNHLRGDDSQRIDALTDQIKRLREALNQPDRGRLDADQPEPPPEQTPNKAVPSLLRGMRRHPLGLLAASCVLALLIVAGVFGWRYVESYQSTDDAQIEGHIHPISARINGTVQSVYVENDERVAKGQLLLQIDPRDYQGSLQQARANLNQALAEVNVARQQYHTAVANLNAADASSAKAQRDALRYRSLLEAAVVSQEEYDRFTTTAKADAATANADHAAAGSAFRMIASKTAAAQAAQATLAQAELNIGYTRIYSPSAGIVGKKTVETAQRVQPGESLLAVVNIDDVWVTADFKENQLARMRPGQPVTIHVDAFNHDYQGYVEHMPGATGEKFSLLPPESATGNYVKVVQRLPVRIRFDAGQDPQHRFRPGMSVEPTVWLKGSVNDGSHQPVLEQRAAR